MVKLTVFFTVIVAGSLYIDKADSSPQNIDIQNLLQSLQQQLQSEQQQVRQKAQQSRAEEEDRDDDNDNEGRFGSLKKQDVERLLGLAPDPAPTTRPKERSSKNDARLSVLDLKKYLQQKQAATQQAKLAINDLLGLNDDKDALDSSSSEENTRNDENPNGYSKVYVVLNTEAIKRSKNKDKLNSLLSSLLAVPPVSTQDRKKPPSYKGFVLNNKFNLNRLGRRLNRDSSEIYAKDNMGAEKERPMRPRERYRDHGRDRGGGGGSGGGRTAIPYIRHRGDIYERDE